VRLIRADIRNFKSIEALSFSFQPSCRVLVGINESGKSNILQALSLLDPEAELEPGDLREIRPNEKPFTEAYVRFVFKIEPADQARVINALKSKIAGDLKHESILKIGRRELSIADFVRTRTEALYVVDLTEDERRQSYQPLTGDEEIVGPWKWLTSGGSTEFTIIDSTRSEFADSETRDFDAEELDQLVAAEFNVLLSEQMPTVIFWEYDENQLLPGEIVISEFAANPEI